MRKWTMVNAGFLVVSLVLWLHTTSTAQFVNHVDAVAVVKAQLVARGVDLSGPCGAFQIVKRVAWNLRSEGAGLLEKPSGNQCDGFATDIIAYPSGQIVDILSDAGGANGPAWQIIEPVDPGRYRPPMNPGDTPPTTTTTTSIPPSPPPIPIPMPSPDLGPVLERMDEITRLMGEQLRLMREIREGQVAQTAALEAGLRALKTELDRGIRLRF